MEFRSWIREHVAVSAGILSVISIALVFAAALQRLPTAAIPRVEALLAVIPHVNAIVSLAAIGTILAGVRAIRRDDVRRHRALMLTSFALFAAFLLLYLYRVALIGPSEFSGPGVVRTYLYLPFLFVHVSLAVLCLPFVFHALLSAGTRSISSIRDSSHARAGRIAATLWVVSFSMGIVIYALLYHVY